MDGVTEPTVFLSCRSPTAEAAGSASVESDERTARERLQYEASLQYEARLRVAEAQSRVDKLTQREEQIEDQLDELRDQLASFTSERPQTTHGGSDERGGGRERRLDGGPCGAVAVSGAALASRRHASLCPGARNPEATGK